MREITVQAKTGNLLSVRAFVNEILEEQDCSRRKRIQIDVCLEILSDLLPRVDTLLF